MEVHSSLVESSQHNIYYTKEIQNQKKIKKSNNNLKYIIDDDYNDDYTDIKSILKKRLEKPKNVLYLPRFTIVFDFEIHDVYIKSRGKLNVQRFFKMLFRPISKRENDAIL